MRSVLILAIVVGGGIYAVIAYKEHAATITREAVTPVVVNVPAAPPLSLEERAARAQGTTLPPEARRPYPPAPVDEPVERTDSAVPVERADSAVPAVQYQCDGRSYCSQMHSCTEAKWFLKHCPGMNMDGEGDGIPCERQWCKHPFSP